MDIIDMSDLNREEYTKKDWKKEYNKRYDQLEKCREARKRYEQSEKGKALDRAKWTKRKAQKLNATVAWKNENKIFSIYTNIHKI